MKKNKITIIGLGNPLMGDEGLGIAAIDLLKKEKLPPNIEIIEGGTLGYQLINFLEGKDKVILVDAIDAGRSPGTIFCKKVVNRGKLTKTFYNKFIATTNNSRYLSLHQTDIKSVLSLTDKLGKMPNHLTIYGIQVKKVELSPHFSLPVKKSLKKLIQLILKVIA